MDNKFLLYYFAFLQNSAHWTRRTKEKIFVFLSSFRVLNNDEALLARNQVLFAPFMDLLFFNLFS